jgi:asparagine synthase (glutamine-hydrolysing)
MLDHNVAALAARIPIEMKVHNGTGKSILRDLLHKTFPPALFDRPKSGFSIPVGIWLRNELRPWADDLLSIAKCDDDGCFDRDAVARMWQAHLAGTRDFGEPLWAVLMFQAWKLRWM